MRPTLVLALLALAGPGAAADASCDAARRGFFGGLAAWISGRDEACARAAEAQARQAEQARDAVRQRLDAALREPPPDADGTEATPTRR
jgi:hypothetical protein